MSIFAYQCSKKKLCLLVFLYCVYNSNFECMTVTCLLTYQMVICSIFKIIIFKTLKLFGFDKKKFSISFMFFLFFRHKWMRYVNAVQHESNECSCICDIFCVVWIAIWIKGFHGLKNSFQELKKTKKNTKKKTYCLPVIFLLLLLLLCVHKYMLEKDMCVHLSSSFDFSSDIHIQWNIQTNIVCRFDIYLHIVGPFFYCIHLIVFVLAI